MAWRSWFTGGPAEEPALIVPTLTEVDSVPPEPAARLASASLVGQGFRSLGVLRVAAGGAGGFAEIWLDGGSSLVGSVSAAHGRQGVGLSFATYQGSFEAPRGIAVNNRPDNRVNKVLRPGTYQLCLPDASQAELLAEHQRQRAAYLVGPPLVFHDLAAVKRVQDFIHRQR